MTKKASEIPHWVSKAASIIAADIRTHFTIEEIALKVGTNSYTLKKEFKKAYGTGMYQYLQVLRVESSKDLLHHTDYSIKVIARQIGYRSPSSFIATFRKIYGITPENWRKQEKRNNL